MNRPDPHALDAVARVRRIREQDSRAGLQLALGEARDAQARVTALEERLGSLAERQAGTSQDFVTLRRGLLALAHTVTEAQDALESALTLAASAHAHWQQDRMRLRTIEMLQDSRLAEVHALRVRAEAKVQDETATQLWRRRDQLRGAS
jgi:flagellar FliJ protein